MDGLAKASILDINGLTVPSAFTGLLDTYTGSAAGYSVRRIASSATNLMRIREDSGDTETDIGYDSNGDLDTAAIASHCGTANGFIVSWVDQSGNGNDATQSTVTRQPQIYNGTAVITENGKPSIKLVDIAGTSTLSRLDLASSINSQLFSYFFAASIGGATASRTQIFSTSDTLPYIRCDNSNRYVIVKPNDFDFLNGSTFDGSQAMNSLIRSSSSTVTSYQDGSQTGTISTLDASNMSFNQISCFVTSTNDEFWLAQEIILWENDQSSNRTGIETDINGYFSIY